jgi:uncharacterized protein
MFHFYLTLAYIIPNIYVFFRIKHLFISRRYRLLYTIIYLLLAAVYPVAENLSDHSPGYFMQLLSTIAGYLLPFYLYVFLSVLVFELFLLTNRLFKWVSKDLRKSFTFRFYAFLLVIGLSVAVVVGGVINLNTIRVSHYQITVPKRNSQLHNLRVVFVADFHIQENTSLPFVKQFVRKVNALEPDIMLYGGDIVEGRDENKVSEDILSALRKVQSIYGAFGVPGNHEYYGSRGNGTFYEKADITLLRDTIMAVDKSFYLAGRNDERDRQRKSANEVLQGISADLPIILLDHRPTRLQEVSRTPVNVQFSGHTHNGQLFPVNFYIRSLYELSWGYKKITDTHFFVTSGLRLWGPPVKTAGKSEIMLVDIKFE